MRTTEKGGSRALLRSLRTVMARQGDGQARLDKVVRLVASNMVAEVCSIYLKRDDRTLELCATEGLNPEAVHRARLRVGQGLVGRIAQAAEPFATDDAQNAPGFRYLPETNEEIYRSFVGVPVQRLGEVMGVLVVQNRTPRRYTEDEVEALEVVAMVIAEMTEAGAFLSTDGLSAAAGRRAGPLMIEGSAVCDGVAEGVVHLHEPRLVVFDPIADDIETERRRLAEALSNMREDIDRMIAAERLGTTSETRDIFEAYRMFARDKGWMRRLDEAVESGLAAEVAVEKVQSIVRARMERATDPYLRDRLHDLDDLANRLLRYLSGGDGIDELPEGAILVARSIGPAELLDHAGRIRAVVLEEGSHGSHASIVARAINVPMIIGVERITRDANPADAIVVDGDQGRVHLRPEPSVLSAFREKIGLEKQNRAVYRSLAKKPAETRDGQVIRLRMNAGILADLPSLEVSGAEGVGLFRTELQFMIRGTLPGREIQAALYDRVLTAAKGREVIFRTLDIGSDKILPYLKREVEPNPALGWRAMRVALDRPLLFRMQVQALIRAAKGRPLSLMFPMITEGWEFLEARQMVRAEVERLVERGVERPEKLRLGLMLETPSLVFAPQSLFETADFVSVGGNDLLQFFFAADRENDRVRRRYDLLNETALRMLAEIVKRCDQAGTPLSYCGEAAGRPLEAIALAAIGFRELSMRPASIGPVKRALRNVDLDAARAEIERAFAEGQPSARPRLRAWRDAERMPY
ncbi:MAG: phosphoenolpyruvate--protein phosphotransferase [Pseudomonadota bacterium]